jgi:hypothetical protein
VVSAIDAVTANMVRYILDENKIFKNLFGESKAENSKNRKMGELKFGDDERFFNIVLIGIGLCIFLGHMVAFMLFRPPKLILEKSSGHTNSKVKSE